jgi:hypothetical protein
MTESPFLQLNPHYLYHHSLPSLACPGNRRIRSRRCVNDHESGLNEDIDEWLEKLTPFRQTWHEARREKRIGVDFEDRPDHHA